MGLIRHNEITSSARGRRSYRTRAGARWPLSRRGLARRRDDYRPGQYHDTVEQEKNYQLRKRRHANTARRRGPHTRAARPTHIRNTPAGGGGGGGPGGPPTPGRPPPPQRERGGGGGGGGRRRGYPDPHAARRGGPGQTQDIDHHTDPTWTRLYRSLKGESRPSRLFRHSAS